MSTIIYINAAPGGVANPDTADRQEKDCRALCEREGWTVDTVLRDTEEGRPEFERLLQMEGVARVVVWCVEYLARPGDSMNRVLGREWPVESVTSGYFDLSNPLGKMVARIIGPYAVYAEKIDGPLAEADRDGVEAVTREAARYA